jgi:hypothetical protein
MSKNKNSYRVLKNFIKICIIFWLFLNINFVNADAASVNELSKFPNYDDIGWKNTKNIKNVFKLNNINYWIYIKTNTNPNIEKIWVCKWIRYDTKTYDYKCKYLFNHTLISKDFYKNSLQNNNVWNQDVDDILELIKNWYISGKYVDKKWSSNGYSVNSINPCPAWTYQDWTDAEYCILAKRWEWTSTWATEAISCVWNSEIKEDEDLDLFTWQEEYTADK